MMNTYYIAIKACCTIILTIAVSVPLYFTWPVAKRLDLASKQLLECQKNPACLQSQILAITGSTKAKWAQ